MISTQFTKLTKDKVESKTGAKHRNVLILGVYKLIQAGHSVVDQLAVLKASRLVVLSWGKEGGLMVMRLEVGEM